MLQRGLADPTLPGCEMCQFAGLRSQQLKSSVFRAGNLTVARSVQPAGPHVDPKQDNPYYKDPPKKVSLLLGLGKGLAQEQRWKTVCMARRSTKALLYKRSFSMDTSEDAPTQSPLLDALPESI